MSKEAFVARWLFRFVHPDKEWITVTNNLHTLRNQEKFRRAAGQLLYALSKREKVTNE